MLVNSCAQQLLWQWVLVQQFLPGPQWEEDCRKDLGLGKNGRGTTRGKEIDPYLIGFGQGMNMETK